MNYANVLEQAQFQRESDRYFWQEVRRYRIEQDTRDLATAIAHDVIWTTKDCAHRRSAFVEETVDDGIENFVRDLLDDVASGIDPTETIRRRILNWSTGVAQYEIERGEA
jgi:hypothetical protein